MTRSQLIEQLADKEHASWARWMAYLFSKSFKQDDGSYIIPASFAEHWQREVDTDYEDLPEKTKESDRAEVELILPIIENYAAFRTGQAGNRP